MADAKGPSSAGQATDAAVVAPGPFEVAHAGARIGGEAVQVGPVGVRLKQLKVTPPARQPVDLHERAADLEARLRPGGERLRTVEVDARLGGGTLRTRSEDIRRGRYFQVDLSPAGDAELRRFSVDPNTGERHPEPFDLTRDQLEGLVDQLAQLPSEDT